MSDYLKFMLLISLNITLLSADIGNASLIRKANKAIKKGNYQKAQQIYSGIPNDNCRIIFNKGYLEAASKNFQEAENYYQLVTASTTCPDKIKARALFNLGNDNLKQRKINKAVKYYRQALMLDPGNKKVIHNLEIANNAQLVKQMPRVEQEQNNKNNQQDNDQKKEEKDEKQGQGEDKKEKKDDNGQNRQKQKNVERILDSFKDDELKALQDNVSKQELKNDVEKDW